ncbi:hypothetical protein, partial [Peribacillus frigoritolerans]|uniref:hypothetical protein n=1 Tax=Peribacillus frigoritolerans TaxID=450367 RepID=UPI002E217EBB|nr:hypothetical protein [Peribacillus frigoritolerans]
KDSSDLQLTHPLVSCEVSLTLQDPKRGLTVNFKKLIFTFSKEKTYKYMLYYGTTKKEELFMKYHYNFIIDGKLIEVEERNYERAEQRAKEILAEMNQIKAKK